MRFESNPNFENELKKQLQPQIDKMNREIELAIKAHDGDEAALVNTIAAIMRKHRVKPDLNGIRKKLRGGSWGKRA